VGKCNYFMEEDCLLILVHAKIFKLLGTING
jgi:hypothetical protein